MESDTNNGAPKDGNGVPETEASDSSSPHMHVGPEASNDEERPFSPPVWMRESSKTFHWRWVPFRIRQASRSMVKWTKGPDPPQIQKITPFFPAIQEAPVRWIDERLPKRKHKVFLLAFFYCCWILIFSLVLVYSNSAGQIEGFGKPDPVWCGASYWSAGNGCGLNGNGCRPFSNTTFAFRCPANCARVMVLNPHAVGDQEINYQALVVGGPSDDSPSSTPVYRGDSFLCQAAIHAGVVTDTKGGCGVVQLLGERSSYTASKRNGMSSVGFDALFPKSYTFVKDLNSECIQDLRWPLLAVTVTFTTLLSLCTVSPLIFFASIFLMLFFHVGLVSDPPSNSALPSLASLVIGRFLPAALGSVVIYRYSVRHTLSGISANVEKTILWLGGAWVGSLNNYTFDFIPIQRLTPHDLRVQPGARIALAIVILLLLAITTGQIYYFRLEGRLRRYLALYGIFIGFLLMCVAIPPLHLRIHHYFLALLLLPGTRLQTRPSLLYQGILVGLFINGTARWGFDSILQTTAALRDDGPLESLLPNITSPLAISATNITFAWAAILPLPHTYDGLSVLVNDVERFRWYVGEGDPTETFDRLSPAVGSAPDQGGEMKMQTKEYFRFGFMSGSDAADYTQAGVWEVDGTWRTMKPGPSKFR